MDEKIKIIIADDNKAFCKLISDYLKKHEDIEILGIAYNDEDEIKMIEELKPEIVITDLVRNHKYTGLEIIKDYYSKNRAVEFLVISADERRFVITNDIEIAGYIKKPFTNYEIIYSELIRIKEEIIKPKKLLIENSNKIKLHSNFFSKILEIFKGRVKNR